MGLFIAHLKYKKACTAICLKWTETWCLFENLSKCKHLEYFAATATSLTAPFSYTMKTQ